MLFGWSVHKLSLVLINICAGVALIMLSFSDVLPLSTTNLIFFSFVGFLLALYRPGWAFLLLVGMLPYEIINLAPESFGLTLRPYQWLLGLVVAALVVRLILRRFPFEKFVPNYWDVLVLLLWLGAMMGAVFSDHQMIALRLSLILFSFVVLYFVCRIFVRTIDDARMVLPFILSSFVVVAGYAIVQNMLFLSGKESLEVMAGRPNAMFHEADWLGGYLALLVTLLIALIVSPTLLSRYVPLQTTRAVFSALLLFGFVALLLTVSRSAWLAACGGIGVALALFGWQRGVYDAFRYWNKPVLKRIFFLALFIGIPLGGALFFVKITHLTPFNLFDRGRSISSGEQKITIACSEERVLPTTIDTVEALAAYGCEHIRLEEIESKRAAGAYITEVFRNDPNVSIRKNIYQQSIIMLKQHWIQGIGFGVLSETLGTDERGAQLNASNLFLEIWLGAGLIGFLAFLMFWLGRGGRWLVASVRQQSATALILFSLFVSATLFNLFNAGLLLGWFFVLMALLLIQDPKRTV